MKRITLGLLALLCSFVVSAQTLPEFSTDSSEVWYYIQFQNGGAVLQDMGDGSVLQTQKVSIGNADQLWKVVGTQTNCEIVSKNGRHIYYTGTAQSTSYRFAASSSQTGGLSLYATQSKYAPAWEIQVASIPGYSMNQWGGAGTGKQLGDWNEDDVNNPLLFVTQDELTMTDTLPSAKAEYSVSGKDSYVPDNKMTLWYKAPVTVQTCDNPWMDYALPIGNGQLGAMVYGGIRQDVLQFNEKTLWEGSSTVRGAYQTFGNLYIEDESDDLSAGVTEYIRQLDLDNATASASWSNSDGSVGYTRQYIASYPDQCIAIHLHATQGGKISNRFYLYNPHGNRAKYADGEGSFSGKLTTVSYNARFKVVPTGGEMTTDSSGVTVKGADEVLVILSAGTDYSPTASGYISGTTELAGNIQTKVESAADEGWTSLLERHVEDYQALYHRVDLDLGAGSDNVPTDVLISGYNSTTETSNKRLLEEMYFQYGRYLMISSSRGIDLPNNLQGIWNNSNSPSWQCDMHADINVQMNYWPAEKTNLPELHEKFLNYLYNMSQVQPQWQSYAKDRAGQTTGWVNYTENNIFGHCTTWRNEYVEASAWECSHLWQHYRYTLDKDFLKEKAMPVMLSCVRFWMERLVKDTDNLWVCPNEWSPEHGPTENGTAHSQQIVWNLFSNTIQGIDTLGVSESGTTDTEFAAIKEKFASLDDGLHTETYNGTFGSERFGVKTGDTILREWKYTSYATGNEGESNHRHLSHLMALYPLDNISASSPYFTPAVNSLKLRGLQSQGWSMGWKMNLWARAQEGDSCQNIFSLAFRHSTDYVINMSSTAGGVYYNLLDSHSPFQIDGNFGVCAGMSEMLLQNQKDTILLLPALSPSWQKGSVEGLKAEGNFTVGMEWTKSLLTSATILSNSGQPCWLQYAGISSASIVDESGNPVSFTVKNANLIYFATESGQTYSVTMPTGTDISSPGRIRQNLNREWKFYLGDVSGAEASDYDDSQWTATNLPHSFSIPYFMWKDVYHGYGWYRKTITIPEDWKNKEVDIQFEGSFIDTEVYLNGHKLGEHVGGYTGFNYDLTPYLQTGDNTLAVRVNNIWNARVAPRAGDHQFSGGIYRDVWLNVTDKIRVDDNGTFIYTPVATKDSATVVAKTEIRNDFLNSKTVTLRTSIYDPSGTQVAWTDSTVTVPADEVQVFAEHLPTITSPELWSPETPNRYTAITTITLDGVEVDRYLTKFGIRKMEWTGESGFYLNGEHYYLLGANVHQDQAGWGDAVTNGAMARDVQMMKDAGFNCIRGSHYPHDPAFAQACDSIGMILFMEMNFWGMGGNTDEAAWGEGAPASSYPTVAADQPYFDQSVLSQLKEEIHIHRNSPSIAAWSLCNEPFFCTDAVDAKMKALLNAETDSARSWDPTREVAIGGAQRKSIDKLGKNAIAFYNGDGASRSDNQDPGVPNLVSEYGTPVGDRPGSFEPCWGDLTDGYTRPAWRGGQVIWCGFDHGTVGGYGLAKDGLVDYFRLPKRYYYWYVEAYKKGNTSPVEPEWPSAGIPAKLSLSASNTTITSCDGTQDAQIIVTVEDSLGKHISNSIPVTLKIVSGPGEFPTGRSITFTPPTAASYKEVSKEDKCDIRIMDGQAAIAFRSYYGGTTVIRAVADSDSAHIDSTDITITTLGTPQWQEGVDIPVADRPYKRYTDSSQTTETSVMTLAENRPTWSSSDKDGTNKAYANDGNSATIWEPESSDTARWWMVCLESQYSVNRIELTFPSAGAYRYIIEVSKNSSDWTKVVDQSQSTLTAQTRMAVGKFGDDISYVRVRFTSTLAGLSEMRVGGSTDASTLDDSYLSGTIIGTEGSYGNNADAEKEAAMDFDTDTYFDGPSGGSPFWVGLDLGYGTESNLAKVAYMPRYNSNSDNYRQRMIGGQFQVASQADFSDASTVYTITAAPAYQKYTVMSTSDSSTKGRYVRYLSTDAGNGNVAELQFYGSAVSTGIKDMVENSQRVEIHAKNRHILILGAQEGMQTIITDDNGATVYQGFSRCVAVPHGLYIVKVGPSVKGIVVP